MGLPPPPLALTMGEPAGIGGEITLKSWVARNATGLTPFFVLDNPARLRALCDDLDLDVPVREIVDPTEALAVFADALPVLSIGEVPPVQLGKPAPTTAQAVLRSIDQAVVLARGGLASAVVTNPIQKAILYGAGFSFQGHTDYLASLCEDSPQPVMMLASEVLRVVPVTVHIPLSKVSAALTTDAIIETGRISARALAQDFSIPNPRLAIAGLNPHAGEEGGLGKEDASVIAPAIAALNAEGITASGPYPADSMFHAVARKKYDAALCMYHDQALIPIKTIAFDSAVNVTLGLPFVRTSPDHGTALDIANQGVASPAGLVAALKMAAAHATSRAKSRVTP